DADDERQQYTMVVQQVTAKLQREAKTKNDGGVVLDGQLIGSYSELVDLVLDRLSNEETRGQWAGTAVGQGTVNAFIRRLISSTRDIGRLVRGDLPPRGAHGAVGSNDAQVTVVD